VYGEKVVGEVEALSSAGRGGSFFEDGGYGDVKAEPTGTPQGGISTKGGAPETGTTLCLVRNADVPDQTINGIEFPFVLQLRPTSEFSAERSETVAMQCWVPDAQAQEYMDDQRPYVQLLTFSDQYRSPASHSQIWLRGHHE